MSKRTAEEIASRWMTRWGVHWGNGYVRPSLVKVLKFYSRQEAKGLVETLMLADTLITNLKVYHGFPAGDDCDAMHANIRNALKESS